jgi:hypothetical protein
MTVVFTASAPHPRLAGCCGQLRGPRRRARRLSAARVQRSDASSRGGSLTFYFTPSDGVSQSIVKHMAYVTSARRCALVTCESIALHNASVRKDPIDGDGVGRSRYQL